MIKPYYRKQESQEEKEEKAEEKEREVPKKNSEYVYENGKLIKKSLLEQEVLFEDSSVHKKEER